MSIATRYKEYNQFQIWLTAGKVASLWRQYQTGTMVSCGFRHFLAKLEDKEMFPVLEYALKQARKELT